MPEFPSQTHAFFWREMQAMEENGARVTLFSTRHPETLCPHAFASEARDRTQYLFPPDISAAAGVLLRHPLRGLRAVFYILGLHETPLPKRLHLLGLLPSAADLLAATRRDGIAHVHIHSCANAAHLGALAHILGDLNYSLTLHGDLPVYGTDHPAKMEHARFVSAVTKPLQGSLETQIGPGRPYPVIWMGVDTERFRPDPAKRTTRPATRFEVVTVARLNPNKGHRFFLRAMALLRDEGVDIHYRIAGSGSEEAAIETEVEKLGLEEHVTLLGAVGEETVLELLQSSDALALTSIKLGEAAPVAVMEAMACGLPAICSVIGGTADMIEDGVDGILVPQEDVDAIARAAGRLARDPDLRTRMSQAARASAERQFDHRVNARALLDTILDHGEA